MAGVASMTRSPWKGPRSLTIATASRPLSRLRILTQVPKGSVLWAIRKAPGSNGAPLAVGLPVSPRPYHDATQYPWPGACARGGPEAQPASASSAATSASRTPRRLICPGPPPMSLPRHTFADRDYAASSMAEPSKSTATAAGQADTSPHASLASQLDMMVRALWASSARNAIMALGASAAAIIVVTAYGQVRLNRWNQPFYDALSRRNMRQFGFQLIVFAVIAGSLLLLNVAQRWIQEMLKLKLREGLVHDLVGDWMRPRRAFQLESAGPIGVNPDQRMHEDARHLTELSGDLALGLMQASALLVSFVGVLWSISSGFVLKLGGVSLAVPGYMVWAAIVYSLSASLLTYWTGRRLIPDNASRYAREADLR